MSYQEVQVSLPGIKPDQIIIVYVEGEEEGEEGGMLVKYDLSLGRGLYTGNVRTWTIPWCYPGL